MRAHGHRVFADELARFAEECAEQRVREVSERVAAPLRVAVGGRPGAGCRTVARALDAVGRSLGISVMPAHRYIEVSIKADVLAYVVTEVVKPEDADAIAGARCPVLLVLNKADLCGFGGDGPLAAAQARCQRFSALVGAPAEPMIGLLAVAALDDVPGDGLTGEPRLLETLDLFGAALAVAAVRRGHDAGQVRALLRRVSGVDAVVDRIVGLGAEVRYRRVLDAVAELEALAVSRDPMGERIGDFLCRDDTVIARMGAAVDVVEAAGLATDTDQADPGAHLPRAVRWQRFSEGGSGPVSDVHRACGTDIARGSLRLWSRVEPGAKR
jgi:hypothetical protein